MVTASGNFHCMSELAVDCAERGVPYERYCVIAKNDDWECNFIVSKAKYAELLERFEPEED